MRKKKKKGSDHKNKANDFIKIIKATIWFSNMLQNIEHDLQYKVVSRFYTVPFIFKRIRHYEKIAHLSTTCTTIAQ